MLQLCFKEVNMDLSLFFRYFSRVLMLLLVLPLTNSVRGLVAKSQGDDSAEKEGRISLNPMDHLDPLGAIAILLCGFGWSKPFPLNPSNFKNYKKGVVLVSLAGPLTHFVSAWVCKVIVNIMLCHPALIGDGSKLSMGYCIAMLLSALSSINICLGVINLLPIPPMDGFNLLYQLSGSKFKQWYYNKGAWLGQYSMYILLALFFLPTLTGGLIDPLGWLVGIFDMIIDLAASWVYLIFGR